MKPNMHPTETEKAQHTAMKSTFRILVAAWMAAFQQRDLNLKQLRRLWRAWKYEGLV